VPSVDVGLQAIGECPAAFGQPGQEGGALVDLLACLIRGGTEETALSPGAQPPKQAPGGELLQQPCLVRLGDGGEALVEPASKRRRCLSTAGSTPQCMSSSRRKAAVRQFGGRDRDSCVSGIVPSARP
jgi:hypothetical protein